MKVLLFGNKGQLGREIEALASVQNLQIVGFDVGEVDIVDLAQVEKTFAENALVDVVINAAAYTAVDKAEDEKALAFAVNRDAVKNLAQMAAKYDLPLLHISTDYVFSGDQDTSYRETDKTDPLGVYGESKLAGEEILLDTWSKSVVVRTSWVFGQYGQNFVKTILRLAQAKENLNVVGDQIGCPTSAADLANVLITIAEKLLKGEGEYGLYHYSNLPAVSWYEFAKQIVAEGSERFDLQLKTLKSITTEEYPTKARRPLHSVLNCDKILKIFGIEQSKWQPYLYNMIKEMES